MLKDILLQSLFVKNMFMQTVHIWQISKTTKNPSLEYIQNIFISGNKSKKKDKCNCVIFSVFLFVKHTLAFYGYNRHVNIISNDSIPWKYMIHK